MDWQPTSALVMALGILMGCSDEHKSSGDIPIDSLGISPTLWLDATSSEGGVSFGKLSTNGVVESSNLIGSSDSTVGIGGGDRLVVQSGVSQLTTENIRGAQYGTRFNYNSAESVDLLFYRGQSIANKVQIRPSSTIAPELSVDSLVLDVNNPNLAVQLNYGLPEGFELPTPVSISVTREILGCELDGIVDPSSEANLADPSLLNTGAIASSFTRVLDSASLSSEYPASLVVGSQEFNLESGFYDSCLVRIRASILFRGMNSDGSWQLDDLVDFVSTSNTPKFNVGLYVYSAPTTIRVERSAILAQR